MYRAAALALLGGDDAGADGLLARAAVYRRKAREWRPGLEVVR